MLVESLPAQELFDKLSIVKLLPKIWNISLSASDDSSNQNEICCALQIPLVLALGKGGGCRSNTYYWANNQKCVCFMGSFHIY